MLASSSDSSGCAWCGAAGALLPAVHLPPPPPPPAVAVLPGKTDVACYASRYPDLFFGFCGGSLSSCDYAKLTDHFVHFGCAEGRSTDTWVDFDFFGHQLSFHLGTPFKTTRTGKVGDHMVMMPHMGAALHLDDWKALAEAVRAKRFGVEQPEDFPAKAKQMRFLQRRGFDMDMLNAAFDD